MVTTLILKAVIQGYLDENIIIPNLILMPITLDIGTLRSLYVLLGWDPNVCSFFRATVY